MRVLMTGARAPVTLDLARRLNKAGHEVFLADSMRWPMARWSRAVRRTYYTAPPAQEPARFVDELCEIVRQERIDFVLPTCEEIFYVAARRAQLAALTRVFCEPLEVLRPLHDKAAFARNVAAFGGAVVCPETRLIDSAEDLAPWLGAEEPSAWVFKPVYSRFAVRTLIGPTRAELAQLRPGPRDRWLAQRRVRGQEYSTYSVAHAGRLRAHACYRSKYRAGRGAGIFFVPESPPGVHRFVEEFVSRCGLAGGGFTGQIGFDFIAGDDGRLYVLECNPRATSGLQLLPDVGLIDALIGDGGAGSAASTVVEPTSDAPVMLGPIMLMYAWPNYRRSGGLREFARDLFRTRDVMSARLDPLPNYLASFALLEPAWTALRRRMSLIGASTVDIEWNGEPQ